MNTLSCPRCNRTLTPYAMNRGMIHTCVQCGQWLDNAASCRLAEADLPDAAHALLRPRAAPASDEVAYRTASGEVQIACPECKAALTAYTTDETKLGATVRLDVCPRHGTWFDHGEAWSLLQSIALKRGVLDVEVDNLKRAAAEQYHERAFQRWMRGGF